LAAAFCDEALRLAEANDLGYRISVHKHLQRLDRVWIESPIYFVTVCTFKREFFDHVLRSEESYAEKWNYVRDNPVRAGLVTSSDHWPYLGRVEFLEEWP
jgi:hypothetical protein